MVQDKYLYGQITARLQAHMLAHACNASPSPVPIAPQLYSLQCKQHVHPQTPYMLVHSCIDNLVTNTQYAPSS